MSTEPEEDDLVAAEYVLGTLDPDERVDAARRVEEETAFAARVAAWVGRLEPLSEAGRVVAPARDLWPSLVRRLGWGEDVSAAVVLRFERQVRRWRLATTAAGALAAGLAVLAVVAFFQRPAEAPRPMVALLQPADAPPAYLIRADLRDRSLAVRPLAAKPPAGKVYELWMIDPALGDPRSLGVLGDDAGPRPLPSGVPAEVAARATYAISVEPLGGSPTGKPSGAPVFVGHLVST